MYRSNDGRHETLPNDQALGQPFVGEHTVAYEVNESAMPSSRITATNLSVHAHLQCDLYLHQSYHHGSANTEAAHVIERSESPAAISLAAFTSGNAWESTLLTHLDQLGLLLTNSGPPLSGLEIASIIELDNRPHVFVAGITFWPPPDRLAEEYAKHGVKPEHVSLKSFL